MPAKAHPDGWTEIPCSASLTLKPQNISWQQGDKEKADRDSVSDGRKYTQAHGSFIRTSFTSTSLHQRQVPLPAHSCHPLIEDITILCSPPVWLGRLKTLSGLSHTTAMGTPTVSLFHNLFRSPHRYKTKELTSGYKTIFKSLFPWKLSLLGKKLIKHWKIHQHSYSQGLLILSQDSKQEAGMGSKGACTG